MPYESNYYLDTSALVKRYVEEPYTEVVDNIFSEAYRGVSRISLSYLNIGESIVVFDKYQRRIGLNGKQLAKNMLREMKTLSKLQMVKIMGITPRILSESIRIILKHHIYLADALQIPSAKKTKATSFVTGDRKLAEIAKKKGLKTIYLG